MARNRRQRPPEPRARLQSEEAILSRLSQDVLDHDTGIITAHRQQVRDRRTHVPMTLTPAQNRARNHQLLITLLKKYDCTALHGGHIENYGATCAVEHVGMVFFVVDNQGKGDLEAELRELGEYWYQDSILFIPRGAQSGRLWGTKKPTPEYPAPLPPFGECRPLPSPIVGPSGHLLFRLEGRPFFFAEPLLPENYPCDYPRGFFGEWGRHLCAKSDDWKQAQ